MELLLRPHFFAKRAGIAKATTDHAVVAFVN